MADETPQPAAKDPTLRDLIRAQNDPADPMHETALKGLAGFGGKMPRVWSPSRPMPLPKFDVGDMPDVVTARRLRETNELLAAMVDIAQADAADARREATNAERRTWWALLAAWVAVIVTVVVGIVQIWVATAGGG